METSEIGSVNSFAIGSIVVEPGRNILSHGADVYHLEPKIMDVLKHLAANQGRVCSRDDIITAVWKVEYGADESLTRAISVIRKTFRQAGGRGKYIQTVSKRGYSLQEPVSALDVPNPKPVKTIKPLLAREKTAVTTAHIDRPISSASETTIKAARPRRQLFKGLAIIFAFILVTAATTLAWKTSHSPETFGSELTTSPYGRSVAVMPFLDLSADKDNQYFSDGISEELSNELRKVNTLRIVRLRLDGAADYNNMSYEEVGDKLKVSHLIHGSVRKQGERVRISAQLINTEDNSHTWSSNHDGTLDDIFELQQRVASDIVLELSLVLSLNISDPITLETVLPAALTLDSK